MSTYSYVDTILHVATTNIKMGSPDAYAPHAEAVVHQQLDARGSLVGERVAVVRVRRADGVDDDAEQPVGTGAHILRLRAQPQRVDADHRQSSSGGAQDIGQGAQLRGVQRTPEFDSYGRKSMILLTWDLKRAPTTG